jgi:hypothetical protein
VDALLGRESAIRTGLMTEADWYACHDPEPLLDFLHDRGSNRQWRLFAVACCRRIDHLITDARSRRAVEVAARYADGDATVEELTAARAAAQDAQKEAWNAEYEAEAAADFRYTLEYAGTCCRHYAAAAARSAVCRDPRRTDGEPGSYEADFWSPSDQLAASAVGANAYVTLSREWGAERDEEARRAEEAAEDGERRAQCDLLRDVFGADLGPPGARGCWLHWGPRITRSNPRPVQWCQLPTPRDLAPRPEWLAWNGGTVPALARAIYAERAFDRLPILADALEEAGCTDAALLAHCRGPGPHVRGCWAIDLILGRP